MPDPTYDKGEQDRRLKAMADSGETLTPANTPNPKTRIKQIPGDFRGALGVGFDGKMYGPYEGRARGGKLTAADRKALPSKDFALPGKGAGANGKGSGSYPINDKSHARNALARVSQHGSPAEKAKVRAKVAAKFPGVGQS